MKFRLTFLKLIVVILVLFLIGCTPKVKCASGIRVSEGESCPKVYCETDADCAHFDCTIIAELNKECFDFTPQCDSLTPRIQNQSGYGDGRPFCDCSPGNCA